MVPVLMHMQTKCLMGDCTRVGAGAVLELWCGAQQRLAGRLDGWHMCRCGSWHQVHCVHGLGAAGRLAVARLAQHKALTWPLVVQLQGQR